MKLLLAPHMDDEALFSAYVCLRESPLVVFCFDGAPRHGSFETRWAEALRATHILGCEAIALREPPDTIEDRLSMFDPEHVWAPLPEPDGNADHNLVGEIAERLWPSKTTYYTTYNATTGRTIVGEPVYAEPSWEELKRQALGCYASQQVNPATRPHFERGLDEYEVRPAMLGLEEWQRNNIALAFDVTPTRSVTISAAGQNAKGAFSVELLNVAGSPSPSIQSSDRS